MYLKLILSVTIFFTLLFLFLFFRTFNYTRLKNIWLVSKSRVEEKFKLKEKITAATKKGEKPFLYEKGATVVYAKDRKAANVKYQKLLLKAQGKTYKKTA